MLLDLTRQIFKISTFIIFFNIRSKFTLTESTSYNMMME